MDVSINLYRENLISGFHLRSQRTVKSYLPFFNVITKVSVMHDFIFAIKVTQRTNCQINRNYKSAQLNNFSNILNRRQINLLGQDILRNECFHTTNRVERSVRNKPCVFKYGRDFQSIRHVSFIRK